MKQYRKQYLQAIFCNINPIFHQRREKRIWFSFLISIISLITKQKSVDNYEQIFKS